MVNLYYKQILLKEKCFICVQDVCDANRGEVVEVMMMFDLLSDVHVFLSPSVSSSSSICSSVWFLFLSLEKLMLAQHCPTLAG